MPISALLSVVAGVLLAVQARMNGELATVSGRGLDAALWSFGSGLVLLGVLLLVSPSMKQGVRSLRVSLRSGRIRIWQCLGGFLGGLYVFGQAYAVSLVGVALFTVAVVGAQTVGGLVVDRAGMGPAGVVPVSWGRVGSALLAVVGVVVAVGDRVKADGSAVVLPIVLAVVAGLLITVQQGINGRVTVAAGSPMTATWLNFALGTVLLAVLAAPAAAIGQFGVPTSLAVPWWAWFGGLLGIVVVSFSTAAVRHLGVLLVLLCMLAGQLLASVALDAADVRTRSHITPVVIGGVLVTVAAVGLAGYASARATRRRAAEEDRITPVAG